MEEERVNQKTLSEKIEVLKKTVSETNSKVNDYATINTTDKAIIKASLDYISNKTEKLNSAVNNANVTNTEEVINNIEKITTTMTKLIINEYTKLNVAILEKDFEELIKPYNIDDDTSVLGSIAAY